eukprot:TRINITY_DN1812_c0_g2_i1.p2 TRINITY_DN1812_c0_g2~~TRINITY_DN1812_c0_g2_i1.p2  ORF type:complete len:186 (-),score=30.99 TRINITY_DN1812_c0_g2_i1:1254-1811(-)
MISKKFFSRSALVFSCFEFVLALIGIIFSLCLIVLGVYQLCTGKKDAKEPLDDSSTGVIVIGFGFTIMVISGAISFIQYQIISILSKNNNNENDSGKVRLYLILEVIVGFLVALGCFYYWTVTENNPKIFFLWLGIVHVFGALDCLALASMKKVSQSEESFSPESYLQLGGKHSYQLTNTANVHV